MSSARRRGVLVVLLLGAATSCERSAGKGTQAPGTEAALPVQEEGERLEKVRAALTYRRAAEQRGVLEWLDQGGTRTLALTRMYLQGSEDLGELTLVRPAGRAPKSVDASISILARAEGPAPKCKATLRIGDETIATRSQLVRKAEPPEGLRVEVDRLNFSLDLATLERLASAPDSGGSACGLAFSLTRAQRDRLDRAAKLLGARELDETAVTAAQSTWDDDRAPDDKGGFRP